MAVINFSALSHINMKKNATNLNIAPNSLAVLERRYLKRDEKGKVLEKPIDLFSRVANNIASADSKYGATPEQVAVTEKKFLELLTALDFLPNSPCLMNAGRELQQLSACFVLPVGDSIDEIFDALKYQAIIHKTGGGTGFGFSRLRPAGSFVGTTSGVASGPVSFMKVFNAATEQIKQGGTRRGANMGILRVDHPDIIEFIKIKEDLSQMTNFNISVAITDKFMKALEKGKDYDLIDPKTKKSVGKLNSTEVFNLIVHHAWLTGDPGVIFIDRINQLNPTRHVGEIEATNPCGEQPLPPYDSCNLGSINLDHFVINDKAGKPTVDWDRLTAVSHTCVHFLDNVIDMNHFPIKQIEETTRANRRIGLGVMGFADMLIRLGIQYNSPAGFEFGKKMMAFIHGEAIKASENLAKARGNFSHYPGSEYEKQGLLRRNSTVTTIAPTGTISMIADCSSGIEPLFSVVFTKTVMDGTKLLYIHPLFEKMAKDEGWYSQELMEKISQEATIQEIDGIPEPVKKLFITAHDVKPDEHVMMQAAFQASVDSSISKTCNFSHEATEDDVARVYRLAYDTGCKGVTIFRDGSRDQQVLTTGKTKLRGQEEQVASPGLVKRTRPAVMRGTTYKLKISYGNLYVTINDDEDGKPFEVFANIGKAGGFFAAKSEAICRLVSLALRSGITPEDVISEIKGIRGPMPSWTENGMILSLPDAIAQVLERHLTREQPKLGLEYHAPIKEDKTAPAAPVASPLQAAAVSQLSHGHGNGNGLKLNFKLADFGTAPQCPECGSILEIGEGCLKCRGCGYSKC